MDDLTANIVMYLVGFILGALVGWYILGPLSWLVLRPFVKRWMNK